MSAQFVIRYGSDRHNTISRAICKRYEMSQQKMQNRHDEWRKSENEHQAYVPETELASEAKNRRDQGEPTFQTLVIPYSYAMLMSSHTYWSTVFLSRDPIVQFAARHGETQQQVQAVEAVQNYQVHTGGQLVPLYVWLLDAGKYGLGVVSPYWDEEFVTVSKIEEVQKKYLGVPIGEKKKVRSTKRVPGYQGNRLFNVRPWDFFPDPRVSLQNLQLGEFCGRLAELGWSDVQSGGAEGKYFNIDALERMMRGGNESLMGDEGTQQTERPTTQDGSGTNFVDKHDLGFVKILEMFIRVVPSEWGLGGSDYPEKWVFTVANPGAKAVIIGARPYGELHDKFPFNILELEPDGYQLAKRSMYDLLRPMQNVMDWLINTHFYNVRRSLNDTIIFDPSRLVLRDLLKPGPGKMVRAKPAAYGTNLKEAIQQLNVSEVTAQHFADAQEMGSLMQRVTGINDSLMAVLAPGGRKSATEVRQANAMGANRLKTQAEYFSALGWAPLNAVMLQMTQQHYSAVMEFRIAGSIGGTDKPFVQVDPTVISGFYDFVPVDGTLPIDRFAQVNLWTQLLGQMRQFPQIAAGFDLAGIFGFVAQLAGLKNISQFKVQVAPPGMAEAAAQAGNIVPAQSAVSNS